MRGTTDRPQRPTLDDIRSGGFSTPWDAPMSPAFPFQFRNVEVLTAVWRTDPAAVERLLPPPLEPVSDVVMAHIYRMNDVDWLGGYFESNIMVGARLPGTDIVGGYSPYLFLDQPIGIAQGREVHGQPKKYGEPLLERREDTIIAQIRRTGIEVLTATMAYKHRRGDLSVLRRHFDFAVNLNLKAIDHIDGTPAIRQITARRLAEVTVHESWHGACTVELRPHIQAPIWRLPVVEAIEGLHWRADFTLVPGTILHDYLAPEGRPPQRGDAA